MSCCNETIYLIDFIATDTKSFDVKYAQCVKTIKQ